MLQVGHERLMFDCGPATTYKLRCAGMAPTEIDFLFFTHHHYDHNADYPCFLLCRWDHETKDVPGLKVYGAPPTAEITKRLIGPEGVFADDWRARVGHPASLQIYAERGGRSPRPEPRYDVEEITPGSRVDTGICRITAGRGTHLQPMMECLTYRVDWDGGSLMVTGDTGRTSAVEDLARGVSTLVVNVWDHQSNMSPVMRSGFCGTLDAAQMGAKAGARRLVIAHQSPKLCLPGSREKAIADMASIFKGELIFGEESMVIELD